MKDQQIKTAIFVIACIGLIAIGWKNYKQEKQIDSLNKDIEYYIDSINRYVKLYPSAEISKLKKENKELYKKIKDKEDLVSAIEFEWKYKYEGLEQQVSELQKNDSLYHFSNQTDTIGYDLQVWATHLAKYKINFNLTNRFILTQQQVGNNNRLEINSYLPGKIQDVTTWSKSSSKPRFGAGVSLGIGYGLINKKADVFVGITGTYLIWR